MPYQHFAALNHGDVTVIAIPSAAIETIEESISYPTPEVKALREEFSQAVLAASGGIVLDMRDTKYLNHASMDLVIQLAKLLVDRKIPRALCCSDEVKAALELCKVDSLIPTVTELDIAVARAAQGEDVGKIVSEPVGTLGESSPPWGQCTKTAILAMVGGLLCTGMALRSLALQSWLVWYELMIALLGGYVCIDATLVCLIRSRFSFNRGIAFSIAGLLIATYGLYFFHIAYTPDLYFHFSESAIDSSDMVLLCDIERGDKLPQYRVAKVLRNRTQIAIGPQSVVPNFDPVMDKFYSRPDAGDQFVVFACDDGHHGIAVLHLEQVFGRRIVGFTNTRLAHLDDLKTFSEFVVKRDR